MRRHAFRGRGRARLLVLGIALLTVAAACSSSPSTSTDGSLSGSLTVSAAASLKEAFTAIGNAFEQAHPAVDITINFGASSTLAQQILDDAPVDVFAAADEATMKKVSDAGQTQGTPTIFATNSHEIIVRKGNPSKITSLADLASPGLIFVSCAPTVPIGAYSAQSLAKAGVAVTPSSLEPDVKGIVSKVSSGEADAGIVYATDVRATKGATDGVAIPSEFNVSARYPIAAVSSGSNDRAATAWIAFVTGAEGQSILQSYGFGTR